MKLTEFSASNGITLKYVMQKSKSENCNILIVVPANTTERENSIDYMFNLSKIKNAHKLFIAATECRFGYYLVKDGTNAPQLAVEELIEKYRIENRVDSRNVYMIGSCGSSYSAIQISVSKGYNAIITGFGFDGDWLFISGMEKEKEEYYRLSDEQRIKEGRLTNSACHKLYEQYTGVKEFWTITKKYLLTAPAEKLSVPNIYFFAGEFEQSYVRNGTDTIRKMRELGMNIKAEISGQYFTHLEMIPYFIEYIFKVLDELRIN